LHKRSEKSEASAYPPNEESANLSPVDPQENFFRKRKLIEPSLIDKLSAPHLELARGSKPKET
jgi:hypothetical protein